MRSQGQLEEERRVFMNDVYLKTFVICQSVLANLDLLSIVAGKHPYLTNIQNGRANNCVSRLSKFVGDIGMHSFKKFNSPVFIRSFLCRRVGFGPKYHDFIGLRVFFKFYLVCGFSYCIM